MTPTLRLDDEALARHTLRRGRDAKSLRPVGFRLDSEGINLAVTLPGPDYLAALLSVGDGLDAYRDGPRLVVRPRGSEQEPQAVSLPLLADGLRDALRDLPARADAGEAYLDLRLAAGTRSPRFGEYALDVVRAYVRTRPALPKRPKARQERPPAKSGAERVREHRERLKVNAYASAAEWLEFYLTDDESVRGWRLGEPLFEECLAYLEASFDPGDELPEEPEHIVSAMPSRQEFYALLDGVLGSRRRTKQGVAYLIPEEVSA